MCTRSIGGSESSSYSTFACQSIGREDGARISPTCEDGALLETIYDDVRTVYEAFQRGARQSENGPCLGYKYSPLADYEWISYDTVLKRAHHVGSGLISLGLTPDNNTFVGIYSQNRPEYVITDFGLWTYSMVGVPLYDTLGTEARIHIINQAGISVVVCDTNAKVKDLLDNRRDTPQLQTVVVMEEVSEMCEELASSLAVKLLTLSEIENIGKREPVPKKLPKAHDVCIVCYTSGTTGLPKGALLTHRGLISVCSACLERLTDGGVDITPNDVLISYLPMAHSYERMLQTAVFTCGAKVGFFQGDVRKLMDDIKDLQPTLFPCVPRLLNRLYDRITAGVNASVVKRFLFSKAIRSKENDLRRHIIRNDSFWDKVVFQKVQAALGGKVRLIASGSAPLSPEVLAFLRCIVGCPLLEGYGQTENHAVCTLQLVGDCAVGTVGPPLSCCAIKLVDIPDMNYRAQDNKGEVCIKGPLVFRGYLKDKVKTDEAIDKDGWLHTGDVGEWTREGTLKIIDRKKQIFKLAQGEYIAPEKIENVYIQHPLVAQLYIYGESLKSCLVGIVVPDPDVLPGYVKQKFNLQGSIEELCENEDVRRHLLASLTEHAKRAGLATFERVKDIYLYPELFSVENNLLTPTFKSKRSELAKFFQQQIEAMYNKRK